MSKFEYVICRDEEDYLMESYGNDLLEMLDSEDNPDVWRAIDWADDINDAFVFDTPQKAQEYKNKVIKVYSYSEYMHLFDLKVVKTKLVITRVKC